MKKYFNIPKSEGMDLWSLFLAGAKALKMLNLESWTKI